MVTSAKGLVNGEVRKQQVIETRKEIVNLHSTGFDRLSVEMTRDA
jgi:hypothetical protein